MNRALGYAGFRQWFRTVRFARDLSRLNESALVVRGRHMVEARRMGKSELFSHFAERFEIKRTQAREFFDELATLA